VSEQPFIYIISVGDDGPIKVGISYSPTRRLAQLQTGCPNVLDLRWCQKLDSDKKAREAEAAVHKEMEEFRLAGEWFDVIPGFARCWVEDIISQ
jgi:hypothetical protein